MTNEPDWRSEPERIAQILAEMRAREARAVAAGEVAPSTGDPIRTVEGCVIRANNRHVYWQATVTDADGTEHEPIIGTDAMAFASAEEALDAAEEAVRNSKLTTPR